MIVAHYFLTSQHVQNGINGVTQTVWIVQAIPEMHHEFHHEKNILIDIIHE